MKTENPSDHKLHLVFLRGPITAPRLSIIDTFLDTESADKPGEENGPSSKLLSKDIDFELEPTHRDGQTDGQTDRREGREN